MDDSNVVSVDEAFQIFDTFPKMGASEYAHGAWAAVKPPKANKVITRLTLAELTDAFLSGDEIEIGYVNAHTVQFVSTYDYSSKERDFLSEFETGGSAALLKISEIVRKASMKVESVSRDAVRYGEVEAERWSAVLVEFGYSERNYNAGSDSWSIRIKVVRNGDTILWSSVS